MPGVSRTCAVMINSLESPVHMNLLEELRKRPVRLRLKRARPAAKLPPPLLECRWGQPFEELRKRPVRLRLKRARPAATLPPPLLECRSGQPFEELWKRPVRLRLKQARPAATLPRSSSLLRILFASGKSFGTALEPDRVSRQEPQYWHWQETGPTGVVPLHFCPPRIVSAWNQTALAERPLT